MFANFVNGPRDPSMLAGARATPAATDDLNFFQKFGLGLSGIENVEAYKQKQALKALGDQLLSGEINKEQALAKYGGITGDFSGMLGVGARAPAAIQEWEKFNSMSDEEKAQYLQMKRANQTFDRGGSQVVLDPTGNVIQEYEKTVPPEQTPELKGQQTAAQEAAKTQNEKEANFPSLESNAQFMLDTLKKAREDKAGMKASVGGLWGMTGRQSSVLPLSEDQRRYQPIVDQLRGQTFLQAYERLKGGGQITEVEGKKGEGAIARLNQAQSVEDFDAALMDLEDVVTKGYERAKAGLTASKESAAPTSGARKKISFGDLK